MAPIVTSRTEQLSLKISIGLAFAPSNNNHQAVKVARLKKEVGKVLDDIQAGLLNRAEKLLKDNVVSVGSFAGLKKVIDSKKIALVSLCSSVDCEDELKFKTNGAKVLNIDSGKKISGKCVVCSKGADYVGRVGKSY